MTQVTKEEVRRVDRVHARADEAVQQRKDGHLITTCTVLHPDENQGEPLIWNDRELSAWPEIKAGLIARLANATSTRRFAIYHDDDYLTGANLPLTGEAEATQKRGYIMYRESAAFIAARPAPSGLTRGDRDGNEARG